jgi:uncharacterized membrane protein YraQ (UPF0718 family)/copper chaperone CopZ
MISLIWSTLLELAPWLLLGAFIAGLLHVVVPKSVVRKNFTGFGGVARAVAVGVPLPLCSCGVIPAGLGLKKDGASDGAVIGFLVSTPQTGVDSILVSASFLGWPFALFKVFSAAFTGLVAGSMAEAAGGTELVKTENDELSEGDGGELGLFAHALDVLSSIWRWLVFGVVVSAAIEYFVPPSGLSYLDAPVWVSSLVALLIGLPLYVCATASVPIAASLVAAGLSPGAALVFLMAGPATNVATIGAIYRTLGPRNLGIYLSVIVVGSLGFGALFDFLIAPSTVMRHSHEHEAGWVAVLSASFLVSLFGWFAVRDARTYLSRFIGGEMSGSGLVEYQVEGMSCGGCVRKLESALTGVDGVDRVQVSLEAGRAQVVGIVSQAVVLEAIKAAGFQGKPAN